MKDLEDHVQNIKHQVQKLEGHLPKISELFDAIKYQVTQARSARRSTYLKARYRVQALAKSMSEKAWDKTIATLVAKDVLGCVKNNAHDVVDFDLKVFGHNNSTQPKVIVNASAVSDSTMVHFWDAGSEFTKAFRAEIEQREPSEATCVETLDKGMAQNSGWSTARHSMGPETVKESTFKTLLDGVEPSYLTDRGAAPWVLSFRRFCFKSGANCLPMSGVGSLVWTPADGKHVTLLLLPLVNILRRGISLENLWSFLGTQAGEEFFAGTEQEPSPVVILHASPGSVVYVPWGYLAQPVFLGVKCEDMKPLNIGFHYLFVESWAAKLTPQCRAAVLKHNLDAFKTKSGVQRWQEMAATLTSFMGSLEVSPGAASAAAGVAPTGA